MSVQVITDKTQFAEFIRTHSIVLVDFHAEWCGPCRAIAPIVKDLAETITNLNVCSVDTDHNQEIAKMYRVNSLPTFLIFYKQTAVKKVVGADPVALKAAVKEICDRK